MPKHEAQGLGAGLLGWLGRLGGRGTLATSPLLGLVAAAIAAKSLAAGGRRACCAGYRGTDSFREACKRNRQCADAARAGRGDGHVPREAGWWAPLTARTAAGPRSVTPYTLGADNTPAGFEAVPAALAKDVWAQCQADDSRRRRNRHEAEAWRLAARANPAIRQRGGSLDEEELAAIHGCLQGLSSLEHACVSTPARAIRRVGTRR